MRPLSKPILRFSACFSRHLTDCVCFAFVLFASGASQSLPEIALPLYYVFDGDIIDSHLFVVIFLLRYRS